MEMPDGEVIIGDWDLRKNVEQYLGNVRFDGKRVLEIGPASGFLTIEMEKRGANVVAIEIPDDPGWDFVPYPDAIMDSVYQPRREVMKQLKNSFWFIHEAYRSTAQLMYTDAYNLPDLGEFDLATMCALLLHCRSPLQIIEQCAKRSKSLIVTDMFYPELEGNAICRLVPTVENQAWDTWWHFSTEFLTQFLRVMGFSSDNISTHTQMHRGAPYTLFTIVASRT
jgi:O-methyltransferase